MRPIHHCKLNNGGRLKGQQKVAATNEILKNRAKALQCLRKLIGAAREINNWPMWETGKLCGKSTLPI